MWLLVCVGALFLRMFVFLAGFLGLVVVVAFNFVTVVGHVVASN